MSEKVRITLSAEEIQEKLDKLYALREREQELRAGITQQDRDIREECESSLLAFAQYAWHILEPESRPMLTGWALEAMCEHLEAVTTGDITRLLINIPPGSMKSLLTRVFWPAWEWARGDTWIRYCSASYNQDLTIRDARRMKEIILSPWYQKLWPHVKISKDQSEKANFENTDRGFMLSLAITGRTTGDRGDRILIDDPHSVKEAESDTIRTGTVQWFKESIPSRMNDFEKSAIIVIMQRVHEDDVSGHILAHNPNYVHLCIPLHYDLTRHCSTTIGYSDPRTIDGENFWPERYTEAYLKEVTAEGNMGPFAIAAQFEQRPEPRGGGIIKDEWWELWDEKTFPMFEFVIASLDTAYTEDQENDYSALTIWGVWRNVHGLPKVMLMNAWHDRLELNPLVEKVAKTCSRFRVDKLLIEPKASGLSVAQELRRLYGNSGWGVQFVNPKHQDKVARAYSVQHLWSDGLVYTPDRTWAQEVIDECRKLPKGTHDDLADSAIQAVRWLRDNGLILRKDERDAILARELAPQGPDEPLYDV